MAESVFTNPQKVIEIIYDGDHDINASHLIVKGLLEEVAKLKKSGLPIKLIMDLSKLGHTDSGSRRNIIHVARTLNFAKVAVFGANTFNTALARFIILASGKNRVIKIFN